MEETKTTRLKESIGYLKKAGYIIDIFMNRYIGFVMAGDESFYIDAHLFRLEYVKDTSIDCDVIYHALNLFMLASVIDYKPEEDLCKSIYETIHNIDPELITTSSLDD